VCAADPVPLCDQGVSTVEARAWNVQCQGGHAHVYVLCMSVYDTVCEWLQVSSGRVLVVLANDPQEAKDWVCVGRCLPCVCFTLLQYCSHVEVLLFPDDLLCLQSMKQLCIPVYVLHPYCIWTNAFV
jgi:hypothetical protein